MKKIVKVIIILLVSYISISILFYSGLVDFYKWCSKGSTSNSSKCQDISMTLYVPAMYITTYTPVKFNWNPGGIGIPERIYVGLKVGDWVVFKKLKTTMW